MLYLLTGMIVIILVLIILVSDLYQRVKYLKTQLKDDREYYDKSLRYQSGEIKTNKINIVGLEEVLYVTVKTDGVNEFQERVSIATILGAVMGELGLSIQCKKLKITKKGDQYYGKEGTEEKRGGSKEKESERVHR